eukprot:PhM_4_TR16897/c0_g2_i1/m.12049
MRSFCARMYAARFAMSSALMPSDVDFTGVAVLAVVAVFVAVEEGADGAVPSWCGIEGRMERWPKPPPRVDDSAARARCLGSSSSGLGFGACFDCTGSACGAGGGGGVDAGFFCGGMFSGGGGTLAISSDSFSACCSSASSSSFALFCTASNSASEASMAMRSSSSSSSSACVGPRSAASGLPACACSSSMTSSSSITLRFSIMCLNDRKSSMAMMYSRICVAAWPCAFVGLRDTSAATATKVSSGMPSSPRNPSSSCSHSALNCLWRSRNSCLDSSSVSKMMQCVSMNCCTGATHSGQCINCTMDSTIQPLSEEADADIFFNKN